LEESFLPRKTPAAIKEWKSDSVDTGPCGMMVVVGSSCTGKMQWAGSFGCALVVSRQWDVDKASRAGENVVVDDVDVMEFGGSSGVS